jgi:hypothetical protein
MKETFNMAALVSLRRFRGYQILGKEEESQVKRDILRKLSRAFSTKRPIGNNYVIAQDSEACSQDAVTDTE